MAEYEAGKAPIIEEQDIEWKDFHIKGYKKHKKFGQYILVIKEDALGKIAEVLKCNQ